MEVDCTICWLFWSTDKTEFGHTCDNSRGVVNGIVKQSMQMRGEVQWEWLCFALHLGSVCGVFVLELHILHYHPMRTVVASCKAWPTLSYFPPAMRDLFSVVLYEVQTISNACSRKCNRLVEHFIKEQSHVHIYILGNYYIYQPNEVSEYVGEFPKP